ncbi:DUF4241 domain-containing protein [Streptomyces mirabilis]|uniref:DUF4241 domain-containing protein n=1 Tax=Streptomyces mirabilis TaxID=68239 RepID=UPI0007C700C9|nr:DUF4241 domain-containing protein [Streptomyces mirabilis]MCX4429428.1 DUF4241 domain-containing protein [Streptomyces mirabilis]
MPVLAPDFVHLFAPGTSHPCPDGVGLLVRVLPGVPLSLPSGRVIAMEPLGCGVGDPAEMAFTQQVRPGTYPVVLVTVDVIGPDGGHRDTRVAAAQLEIRNEPVATWELALRPGEDTEELDDDELFGYPVDGGTGCFVDAQTFQAAGEKEDFAGQVAESLWGRPQTPVASVRECAPITMSVGDDEHAVVVFSTGWGDGDYPTWIGRTADGDVACFLTDFQVLADEDGREAAGNAEDLRNRIQAPLDTVAQYRALKRRLEGMPILTELLPGDTLRLGSLSSRSGTFLLVNQDDGDVVIYRAQDGATVWRTRTLLEDELIGLANRLVLQDSGNLVVFAPTGVQVWNSGTRGRDVQRAVLGDDGRLVLVDADGGEVWSSELLYPQPMSSAGHLE